jgi:hypothetical protein
MAPDTMVAAVAAKTSWKNQYVYCHSPCGVAGEAPERKNPEAPKSPILSAPNMMPNPMTKKAMDPTQKSIMFFIMMLPAFFARVNPVSTIANPACMKNTRNAAISVQTTLMGCIAGAAAAASCAKAPVASDEKIRTAAMSVSACRIVSLLE